MKSLPTIILASLLGLTSGPAGAQQDDYYPALITLIAELANLGVMADRCEKQLVNSGKDALKTEECTGFTSRYHELWPDQASLQAYILEFAKRSERGEIRCDDRCHEMLLRCEELRISVVYVLDYMEYIKEL